MTRKTSLNKIIVCNGRIAWLVIKVIFIIYEWSFIGSNIVENVALDILYSLYKISCENNHNLNNEIFL